VSHPDFDGLRAAVEDAAARAPFDSLLARARGRRRRRRAAGGTAALGLVGALATTVLVLPGTNRVIDPDPTPPVTAEPAPSPTGPTGRPARQLIQTAFGSTTAYALLGGCTGTGPAACAYEVLSSPDAGRTWSRLRTPLPPLPGDASEGFAAQLLVTGEDDLTLLDWLRGRAYASTDKGRTFATRAIRMGPPIDGVPPGLQVSATQCAPARCQAVGLTVFDPATGLIAPLRSQPPVGSEPHGVSVGDDGRIWAAGQDGSLLSSAVSRDRGRTWRKLAPVPAGGRLRLVRVVALPGREAGAFLLAGRNSPNVLNTFSDLWRLDDPDPRWIRVMPPGAPPSALSVVGLVKRELLLTEEEGGAWRTSGRGTRIAREPDPQAPGLALPLRLLYRTGGLLVGQLDVSMLVSEDEGRTWDYRIVVAG